jgi:hypothetical protein
LPNRKLWSEIQTHIETEGIAPNDREEEPRKSGFLYVVGALAMLLIIGIAVTSLNRPPESVEPESESPTSVPDGAVASGQNERLVRLQDEYDQLKSELDGIVVVEDCDENAEVKKSVEQDMGIIEKSISEIIAVVGDEPENEVLEKMLVSTYKRQLKLMKIFLLLEDNAEE